MFTVAICINFLFWFILSSLSSLLSFSFLLFSFCFSSLRCSLSALLSPSVSSQRLSLSDRQQPNLWRWLFEDGIVLVGWWLPWDSVAWVWVCQRGLWWVWVCRHGLWWVWVVAVSGFWVLAWGSWSEFWEETGSCNVATWEEEVIWEGRRLEIGVRERDWEESF